MTSPGSESLRLVSARGVPASPGDLLLAIPVEVIDSIAEIARRAAREEVERHVADGSVGWLDVAGAAAYLSITEKAVRSLVAKGSLPVHRTPTGRLRFRPGELDEWVDRRDSLS